MSYISKSAPVVAASNVSVSLENVKPVSALPSLVRYELLIILVWIFLRIGRHWARSKIINEDEETDYQEDRRKRFDKMGWYILLAAMLGGLVYWLLVDVLFYSSFHSAIQSSSVPLVSGYSAVPAYATYPVTTSSNPSRVRNYN